jgi:hypothetical protein
MTVRVCGRGFPLFLLLFFLGSPGICPGEDMSGYFYSQVRVRGCLQESRGVWTIGDRVIVEPGDFPLSPGSAEITGITYGSKRKESLKIYPLKYLKLKEASFKIETCSDPVELKGKRSQVPHQHPIDGEKPVFDYFDGPLGQMVVYFASEKEKEAFSSVPASSTVLLSGSLVPVFAHSKRPGKEEGRKMFFGFQMKVKSMKVIP